MARPRGRKLQNPELREKILRAAEQQWLNDVELSALAQVHKDTLYREIALDPIFAKRLDQARERGAKAAAKSVSSRAFRRLVECLDVPLGAGDRDLPQFIRAYVDVLAHTVPSFSAKTQVAYREDHERVDVPQAAAKDVRKALLSLQRAGGV